jgi:hypothetical protein
MKLPVLDPEPDEGAELLVVDATMGGFLVLIEPERDEELEPCRCNANDEVEGRKEEPSEGAKGSGMVSWQENGRCWRDTVVIRTSVRTVARVGMFRAEFYGLSWVYV